MRNVCLQNVTWGGHFSNNLSNKVTFFRYGLKE